MFTQDGLAWFDGATVRCRRVVSSSKCAVHRDVMLMMVLCAKTGHACRSVRRVYVK